MRRKRMEMIRKRLMQMREDMLTDLRQKNTDAASVSDAGVPDPGDSSLSAYLTDFLHLLSDSRREEILKIDEALQRLEDGSYGICLNCGEQIPIERLEVQPYTSHCVACKEELEREALRASGPEPGKY